MKQIWVKSIVSKYASRADLEVDLYGRAKIQTFRGLTLL